MQTFGGGADSGGPRRRALGLGRPSLPRVWAWLGVQDLLEEKEEIWMQRQQETQTNTPRTDEVNGKTRQLSGHSV